jgi:hypothetical protein
MAFKLGQSPEHSQHKSAMRCIGIGPSICQGLECCASFADYIESIQEIAR